MAAGCCASPSGNHHHDDNHDENHQDGHHHSGHDHDHDHLNCGDDQDLTVGQEHPCCDDSGCEDAVDVVSSSDTCCDSVAENCDEKCIIAAAALECEKTCEDAVADGGQASHEHEHGEHGEHLNAACSTHLARAFEQYSAYLDSARCICRSVLERGWSSSCCGDKSPVKKRATKGHHHSTNQRKTSDAHIVETIEFSEHKTHGSTATTKERVPKTDIEKATGVETVVLSVDGMTCSGCGNKMERTLKALPGVSAVRVNFVMGNAEFSIATGVASADDTVRAVVRATGFKCTRLSSQDQTLDVLAADNASAKAVVDTIVPGVVQAQILTKKGRTVRVTYDPIAIGARNLLAELTRFSVELAPPRDDPSVASGRKRLYDQLVKTAVAAAFTIPVAVLAWGDNLVDDKTRACVSLALATVVQLIAVPDFYRPAFSALVHSGTIEMDMLVVLSITAAYAYSVVAFAFRMVGQPLETAEFFETSTLLITLVLLGRLVATYARIRAVESVSLRSLQATVAVVVEDGQDKEVDARLLQYGDKLKVMPHTVVPTDAVVLDGASEVDESMLTGEGVPVRKVIGDPVIAGTVNMSGMLMVRLTRLPGRNTVTDIAEMVEEAANSKPKLQDIADRVASWFVPVVSAVAFTVFIIWIVVNLKVRNYGAGKSVVSAVTFAVATMAISCPCALGLAVPLVLVIAGGIAARNGVVIKSAECTERARKVTDVVFDKTGTITEGSMDVTDEEVTISNTNEAAALAMAMVSDNKHPVSLAVVKHLAQKDAQHLAATDKHVVPGAGVEANIGGSTIRAGNARWTGTESHPAVQSLEQNGRTVLAVTRNSELVVVFGLHTKLREEAAKVIAQLGRRNITVHLVSGDQKRAVEAVAAQTGIANVAFECTPAAKREYVAKLMSAGKSVMFVGDGTNDAVAVAQADVGAQLGSVSSASDVTRGAADVVLLAGLEGIPFLMELSRVSFRLMAANCAWAGVYNVLAILLAAGAFVRFRIPPSFAGLGEIVSVLPVVIASSTMLFTKIRVN